MKDKVIFRKWNKKEGGGVIALFPRIPSDVLGMHCLSYQHVGQHSGAHYRGVVQQTTLAKPAECRALAKELRGRGYKLQIAKKSGYTDMEARVAAARKDY